MSRADAIYAAVRAQLDAQRAQTGAPQRRRRRFDLEQDGIAASWAAGIIGGTGGSPAGLPQLAERQAAANGGFSIPLTGTDARLFNVLYGTFDYTHSGGTHYAECIPGGLSTVPGCMVLWTPGTDVAAWTGTIAIVSDEGEAGLWWGSVTAGEFDGYTLTWSQADGAVNLNHWIAGTAFKTGVFASAATTSVVVTGQFTATNVNVSTDIDGGLGFSGITQAPARFGICGLVGNEQVSRFTVTGAA